MLESEVMQRQCLRSCPGHSAVSSSLCHQTLSTVHCVHLTKKIFHSIWSSSLRYDQHQWECCTDHMNIIYSTSCDQCGVSARLYQDWWSGNTGVTSSHSRLYHSWTRQIIKASDAVGTDIQIYIPFSTAFYPQCLVSVYESCSRITPDYLRLLTSSPVISHCTQHSSSVQLQAPVKHNRK